MEISKLLGALFRLILEKREVNYFLANKINKKLHYWMTTLINNIGYTIICNGVLTSSMMFSLGIWCGTKVGLIRLHLKFETIYGLAFKHIQVLK